MTFRWPFLRKALKDAWPVWLGAGGLVAAWLAGLGLTYLVGSYTLAEQVRYTSGLLEVFGVVLVAWDLSELPKVWGAPTVSESIKTWWRTFLNAFRKPEGQTIGIGTAKVNTTAGGAGVVQGPPRAPTLAEQVQKLQEDVKELQKKADALDSRITEEAGKLRKELAQERKERKAGDQEVQEKAQEATIGGLPFAWIGLSWLLVGVLFGSFTAEVVGLLS